jgi:hypothetical protein
MRRRTFLGAGALAGATALSGCAGLLQSSRTPPVPENRPDGIYVPGHLEGMAMAGRAEEGDYAFALTYSYAHRFWNVNGDSVSKTGIDDGDDVHLMASVWDPETGQVLPETGLSLKITRDGDLVSQESIYPMLSQPMGFHYGANFGLEGDGTYDVELSVGALPIRRTGAFRGRFDEATTASVSFEYSRQARDDIAFEVLADRGGQRGAVERMAMDGLPDSRAPAPESLPGTVVGSARSDDAVLVATVLDAPPEGVDGDGRYVAVSARTRYNRMVVPAMGLTGTLARDGETLFEGSLDRTLDPDLGYHYGAVVDEVAAGDELGVAVDVQPQTARHEGYETAFGGLKGGMPDVTIPVSL